MMHVAKREWRIIGCRDRSINVYSLYKAAKHFGTPPVNVRIEQIAHKPLGSIDVAHSRYKEADPSQPVLLVDGLDNPLNRRYRMVDGRHRLLKVLNGGGMSIPAFVFSVEEFFKYCGVMRDVTAT